MQLSHDPISIRLASHALVLGPIPGPNKGPYLIPNVNNTSQAVPQEPTTSEPSCWFLGADSSKNKAGGLSGAVVTCLPYTSEVCGSNLGPQVEKLVDGNHVEPM